LPTAITPAEFRWFDYSNFSFSLGLDLDGRIAQLSGHSASEYDPDSSRIVVNGDMADQTRTAYAKAEAILGAAGYGLDDIVHVVENVTIDGVDHYAEAEAVREEILGDTAPAVNTVVVRALLRKRAWIELEITASKDPGTSHGSDRGRPAYSGVRESDGVVYLSTIHPYDEAGNLVGEDDVVAQTEQIFVNATRILDGAGLGMSNVVKTLDMVRPEGLAGYKGTGRVRKNHLGPVYPGSAGILQDRVAADDRVLISYDFIASRNPTEAVNPGWGRYEKLTYSPAVKAGDMLFMSGQAALDPETERALYEGDVAEQARYTYGNIAAVLEEAGLGTEHLIKTVEYVTPEGLANYRAVGGVRKECMSAPWPASTGAICHSLLRPEFQIEVDPLAMFPADG